MSGPAKEVDRCSNVFVFVLDNNRWIMDGEQGGWRVLIK
jgi:hypothetical protein